jgi:hypothetical protein
MICPCCQSSVSILTAATIETWHDVATLRPEGPAFAPARLLALQTILACNRCEWAGPRREACARATLHDPE